MKQKSVPYGVVTTFRHVCLLHLHCIAWLESSLTVTRFSFDKMLLGRHQTLLYVPRYLLSSSTMVPHVPHVTPGFNYVIESDIMEECCVFSPCVVLLAFEGKRNTPEVQYHQFRVAQYHNGRQCFASSTESIPHRHRRLTGSCDDSHYQLPCS